MFVSPPDEWENIHYSVFLVEFKLHLLRLRLIQHEANIYNIHLYKIEKKICWITIYFNMLLGV